MLYIKKNLTPYNTLSILKYLEFYPGGAKVHFIYNVL